MTTSTFDVTDSAAAEGECGRPPRPEEKTWKYYSRHHEMPASGVSSLAVHLTAVGVLIVGGLLTAKVASNDRPPEIVAALGPEARDADVGIGQLSGMAKNKETAAGVNPAAKDSSVSVPDIGILVPVKPKGLIPDQTSGERSIEARAQEAVRDLDQQAEGALRQAGIPGPGGADKIGPSGGSDAAMRSKIIERRRRWQLNFQVTGPIDHLRQFAALGAILAVPEPEGGFRIFKNLSAWPGLKAPMVAENRHPASERVETLVDIHRIGFAVLGTPQAPYLLAFFPTELEEKMARLEWQFHHRREQDIHSKTYFQVVPRDSSYDVVIDRSRTASH
jgi:hypothetical protein